MPDTLLAPAKLTRTLRITGVRSDGLHEIDAEMVSVDLADTLVFDEGEGLVLIGAAPDVPLGEDNLVCRALALTGRTARVELHKHIPSGAGLGGGSADAAAVLRWAGISDPTLAAQLGADVPFCLRGGRARVTGIGERLEALPFEARTFTLLTPPLHCSTAAVYGAWDDLGGPTAEGDNDLEPAALALVPDLGEWRDRLGEATGRTPTLAGSGSTWFVEGDFPGDGRVVVHTLPASGDD